MRCVLLAATVFGLSAAPALAADYSLGDTLACPAKGGGPAVQIVVGKIDVSGTDAIVSVSMFDDAPGKKFPEAGHAPFDVKALKGCSTVAKRSLSAYFGEGYAMWREAFDKGKAGVFTLSPSETFVIVHQLVPQ